MGHAESGIFAGSSFVPTRDHRAFCFRKDRPADEQAITGASKANEPPPHPVRDQGRSCPLLEELYREGRYGDVIEAAEQELSKGEQSPRIYYWLGAALARSDQRRDAVRMLKRAVYLDPDDVGALRLLSRVYDELGDHHSQETYQRRAERVRRRLERRPQPAGEVSWTR